MQPLEARVTKGLNLSKCLINDTSGSIGIPLKILYDEALMILAKL